MESKYLIQGCPGIIGGAGCQGMPKNMGQEGDIVSQYKEVSVSVSNCCITNHSKIMWLKIIIYNC